MSPERVPPSRLVAEARERCGMTQQQLAQVTGLSITTIQRFENGKCPCPRPRTLRALASALDLDVRDLMP